MLYHNIYTDELIKVAEETILFQDVFNTNDIKRLSEISKFYNPAIVDNIYDNVTLDITLIDKTSFQQMILDIISNSFVQEKYLAIIRKNYIDTVLSRLAIERKKPFRTSLWSYLKNIKKNFNKNNKNTFKNVSTEDSVSNYNDEYPNSNKHLSKEDISYLDNLLTSCKEDCMIINHTSSIFHFIKACNDCRAKLELLSQHESTGVFTNSLPSVDLQKLDKMLPNYEIEFLKRAYIRQENGILSIPHSHMLEIQKNFSQKAIDFIYEDEGIYKYKQDSFDSMNSAEFEEFCADL